MALASIVVIPARDEEDQIAGCVAALGAQTVPRDQFEVIVVLDACSDRTAGVAAEAASRFSLRLSLLEGPGTGAGAARRTGMDVAAERLLADGLDDGLVACTDADSRPAPDWLARQLAHVRAGARAVAGLIELAPEEAIRLAPAGVASPRARRRPAARTDPSERSGRRPSSLRGRIDRSHRRRVSRGRRPRAGRRARGRRVRRATGPGRDPDPSHRRCPRAHLRPARGPRRTGTVGRPGRVFVGGGTALRGERVPARAAAR